MVDEVVAGEGVDSVGVAGDVGDGDGDDLAVPRRRGDLGGPIEQIARSGSEQRGSDDGRHVATGMSSIDDLGDGGGAAHDQLMDHVVGFGGHGVSVGATPDTALSRRPGRTLRW